MLATVISFWAVISVEVLHPDLSEIPPLRLGSVELVEQGFRWVSRGFRMVSHAKRAVFMLFLRF